MKTATIYTAPNCGPCIGAKRWMAKNGVEYNELPAHDHFDYLQELGARAAPVIVIDGEAVIGFDIDKLAQLIVETGA